MKGMTDLIKNDIIAIFLMEAIMNINVEYITKDNGRYCTNIIPIINSLKSLGYDFYEIGNFAGVTCGTVVDLWKKRGIAKYYPVIRLKHRIEYQNWDKLCDESKIEMLLGNSNTYQGWTDYIEHNFANGKYQGRTSQMSIKIDLGNDHVVKTPIFGRNSFIHPNIMLFFTFAILPTTGVRTFGKCNVSCRGEFILSHGDVVEIKGLDIKSVGTYQ